MINLDQLDHEAFGGVVEPLRRELQAYCYRMMGTTQDAEDMVQETFLRAWRRRETYKGRASLRAWLYKIATNICLDTLDKRPKRFIPTTRDSQSSEGGAIPPEVKDAMWLEPYPDDLLGAFEDNPEAHFASRENIALAFIAVLHLLTPHQRAILILRDVLDWSAEEVAAQLETSVSAVKSALHRARTTLAEQSAPQPPSDAPSKRQLGDYVRAWETADVGGLLCLLTDETVFSMPPTPSWYQGLNAISELMSKRIMAGQAAGRWRLLPARANRQTAFGLYRLDDSGETYTAYGIQILTFRGGNVTDIITFRIPTLVPRFGLPMTFER